MIGVWPFTRRREAVFAFRDPRGRRRHADPVAVRRRLGVADPEWADRIDRLKVAAKPPADLPAEWREKMQAAADEDAAGLAAAVATAFELKPLDPQSGGGWAERELIDLLASYLAYCADILERTRPLAVPSPATA